MRKSEQRRADYVVVVDGVAGDIPQHIPVGRDARGGAVEVEPLPALLVVVAEVMSDSRTVAAERAVEEIDAARILAACDGALSRLPQENKKDRGQLSRLSPELRPRLRPPLMESTEPWMHEVDLQRRAGRSVRWLLSCCRPGPPGTRQSLGCGSER